MTDRHSGYLVVLDRDIREDDAAESVLVALRMVKGVLSVEPIIDDGLAAIAEARASARWRERIMAMLAEPFYS